MIWSTSGRPAGIESPAEVSGDSRSVTDMMTEPEPTEPFPEVTQRQRPTPHRDLKYWKGSELRVDIRDPAGHRVAAITRDGARLLTNTETIVLPARNLDKVVTRCDRCGDRWVAVMNMSLIREHARPKLPLAKARGRHLPKLPIRLKVDEVGFSRRS